jgi:hypothetical protein
MNMEKLTDSLTYSCYAFNRRNSPNVSPLEWEKVFGPATASMELRFFLEQQADCGNRFDGVTKIGLADYLSEQQPIITEYLKLKGVL